MIALTVLEEMGITEHETKVFEWSGLIPGINADQIRYGNWWYVHFKK